MKNSPLASVEPSFCVYDLNEVFNAAVSERDQHQSDLNKAQSMNSSYGISQSTALRDGADKVVSVLQTFKDAGNTHIRTKCSLEDSPAKSGVKHQLSDQLVKGQVDAFKMTG